LAEPKRILLVEDEFLVAEEMREEVGDLGHDVIGPIASIEEAVEAIRAHPDIAGALVDINLNGVWAYPVADELMERKIPFAFTTGYDDAAIAAEYRDVPRINKPVPAAMLRKMLQALLTAAGEKAPAA
jgi:CheY-like chemotaxis protein